MEEKDLLQNSCGDFPYSVTTQGELESFSCGDKDLDVTARKGTVSHKSALERLPGKAGGGCYRRHQHPGADQEEPAGTGNHVLIPRISCQR